LRFLGIILRFVRLEVSRFTLYTSLKRLFQGGGGKIH
jgi:hypothetical protein